MKSGVEIGSVGVTVNHKDKTIAISGGFIVKEFQRQGYYGYLRREVMDIADTFGYKVTTYAIPSPHLRFLQSRGRGANNLIDFYKSYGFESKKSNPKSLVRPATHPATEMDARYKNFATFKAPKVIEYVEQNRGGYEIKTLDLKAIEKAYAKSSKTAKVKIVSKHTIKRLLPHLNEATIRFLLLHPIIKEGLPKNTSLPQFKKPLGYSEQKLISKQLEEEYVRRYL